MSTVVDSHQHFWSLNRGDYAWLTPTLEAIFRDFEPEHLAPLLSECGISHTVLVQAAPTVEETAYLLSLAEKSNFVAGVVGWVDFDDAAKALATLRQFARHAKFVGVRPMIHDIDDPRWILNPSHTPVFDELITLDLCFDALVRPGHLPVLQELLLRHPALRVVVDHGGKPGIAFQEWDPWAADMRSIAQSTTAFCKISGLITEAADGAGYEGLVPYMDYLLDCFGAERLMWGSDWPVLNLNGDYVRWHGAAARWAKQLDPQAQAAIFGGNASRFYRLNLATVNDNLAQMPRG